MQYTLPQTLLREIRIFFPTIEGIGITKLTPSDTSRKPLYVACIQHQVALPQSHIQAWLEQRLGVPMQICSLSD
jgi:hypothetical protein